MKSVLYLILTLALLDVLVILHEGGHFLAARLSGIRVNEFSVGMGPALFSRVLKKSGLRLSLRALPFGGYVAMEGEDGASEQPDAFCNRSVLRRLLTVAAGPVTNLLVGLIAMTVLVSITVPASSTVARFREGATSCDYGLREGDTVLAVDGTRVHSGSELVYEIMNRGYRPLTLTVERDGETVVLEGVQFPVYEEQGVTFGDYDFVLYAEHKTVGTVLSQSLTRSFSTVKMVFDSLGDMLRGRYGLDSVSGPIGISSTVGEAASQGGASLLYLFAILSVNLGVMNLLPLPALDGGRLLIYLFELITRKKMNPRAEQYINTAGMIVLLAFMFLITVKDIFRFTF